MTEQLKNSFEGIKLTHDIAALREIKSLLERETASLDNRLLTVEKSVAEFEKQESSARSAAREASERLVSMNSEVEKAKSVLSSVEASTQQARNQEKTALEGARIALEAQGTEKKRLDELKADYKVYKGDLDEAKRSIRIEESNLRIVKQDTDKRIADAAAREAIADAKEKHLLGLLESTGVKIPEYAKPKEQNVTVKI
jgi:chromosome segregation ATPase